MPYNQFNQDHYHDSRYTAMKGKIRGWEKMYPNVDAVFYEGQGKDRKGIKCLSIVCFLVREELRTTRSPGKMQALNEWINGKPRPTGEQDGSETS